MCVSPRVCRWKRDKLRVRDTRYRRKGYVSGSEGQQANSNHVTFHRYHNPPPPSCQPYFIPFAFLLSLPSFPSSLCLITVLVTWRSWPLLCAAGSQALKPSQGEGCKSVSPSLEISRSSADSTKLMWRTKCFTQMH